MIRPPAWLAAVQEVLSRRAHRDIHSAQYGHTE